MLHLDIIGQWIILSEDMDDNITKVFTKYVYSQDDSILLNTLILFIEDDLFVN